MPIKSPGRFPILLASALIVLSGCGKDSTGNTGDAIPVSSVTGTWTITLGDSLPCLDSLAERDLDVVVTGTEDDVEPAGSLTFTETWSTTGGLSGTVYGTINVQSRAVVLHLTRQDTLDYGLELRGALDNSLVLRGLAIDPYQGYQPLLVIAQCTFDIQGTRTSP
jgi:hypothetical protein